MKRLLFCLMGPTASGKTALACELVKHFPLEVISVDSAMIYREMNIGTAKPDTETLLAVPHHLIDILDPPESYSAADFCGDIDQLSRDIYNRGNIPLLVGGTMMYFKALQDGLSSLPAADDGIRKALLQQAEKYGWDHMHQELLSIDPVMAAKIHPHDTQRITRALEVYHLTSTPLSLFLQKKKAVNDYQCVNVALIPDDRAWLHERIARRFVEMLSSGFLQEVEGLLAKWQLTSTNPSMRCVGYRQAVAFLQGEYDYDTLSLKGIAATRQLAKRQLTWLRHWTDTHVYAAENPAVGVEIIAMMKQILDNFKS